MTAKPAETQPFDVKVVEGEVVITGPDGVALSMTPDAAAQSGRRLENAGEAARHRSDMANEDPN